MLAMWQALCLLLPDAQCCTYQAARSPFQKCSMTERYDTTLHSDASSYRSSEDGCRLVKHPPCCFCRKRLSVEKSANILPNSHTRGFYTSSGLITFTCIDDIVWMLACHGACMDVCFTGCVALVKPKREAAQGTKTCRFFISCGVSEV